MMMKYLLPAVMMPFLAIADTVVMEQKFEDDNHQWTSYSKKAESSSTISPTESGVSGRGLKVQLRPEASGASWAFKNQPQSHYILSVEVKGKGKALLCATEKKWSYSPTITLKENAFQTLLLEKFSDSGNLFCALIAPKGGDEGDYFIADNLKIIRKDNLALSDFEVEPYALRLSDYPFNQLKSYIKADDGLCFVGYPWYIPMRFALPLTSRKVCVYAHVNTKFPQNVKMTVMIGGEHAFKGSAKNAETWEWVRLGPLDVVRTPGTVELGIIGVDGTKILVDRIVITTKDSLSDKELDAVPAREKVNALVGITPTQEAMTIDGKDDEGVWKKAIILSPFVLRAKSDLAKEQTRAMLAYDQEYLYFFCQAQAYCLLPLSNERNSLKRDGGSNDSEKLWNDDLIGLVISPGTQKNACYDLFFNPNGFVIDAKYTSGPKFWNSRDGAWDAQAKVKTTIDDGFWTIEAAIPLKSLELSPARVKECFFQIGRIEQRSRETSSYLPMMDGFHDSSEWGLLRFASATPGVSLCTIPSFSLDDNRFKTTLGDKVDLATLIYYSDKPAIREEHRVQGKVSVPVVTQGGVPFKFRYAISDFSTQVPFLISPLYAKIPSVFGAEITGPCQEFKINGEVVKKAAGFLRKGLNTIEVASNSPQDISLTITGEVFKIDDLWKRTAENRWSRKILVEETAIWPNWKKGGLHLSPEYGQQLYFCPQGLRDVAHKDGYQLILELPDGVKAVGASGYYNLFPVKFCHEGEIERNNRRYRRYSVTMPTKTEWENNLFQGGMIHKFLSVYLMPDDSFSDATPLYYYSRTMDKKITEVPQSLMIRRIDKINGKTPKDLRLQMWSSWLHKMNSSDLSRQIFANMSKAGITDAWGAAANSGLKKFILFDFIWYIPTAEFLAGHPGSELVDFNHQKSKKFICSKRFLYSNEGREYITNQLYKTQTRERAEYIVLDFESSVWTNNLACFCSDCLQDFAAQNNISETLTPAIIKKNHSQAWISYMNHKFADAAKLLADASHSAIPRAKFGVYSGYQSEYTRESYGVDWRLLDGKIDYASCGYGREAKMLDATRKALPQTPLVTGVILTPDTSISFGDRYPSMLDKASVMQHFLDGNGGLLFYEYPTFDAQSMFVIGEISRLISEHESVFKNGRRVDEEFSVSGFSGSQIVALREGQEAILIIINDKDIPVNYTITKSPGGEIDDYYAGKPGKLSDSVAPHELKVLIFK